MGNLGSFSSLIFIVIIIALVAYIYMQRRKDKNPPDGHDR